jgi:redox-sensitive bicupin YhaK (pirin superfamily)
VNGTEGPVRDIVTDPDTSMYPCRPAASSGTPVKRGTRSSAYVFEGSAWFDQGRDPYDPPRSGTQLFRHGPECLVGPESLVLYGDGDEVSAAAGEQRSASFSFPGKPIGEPVEWNGPIVMNTRRRSASRSRSTGRDVHQVEVILSGSSRSGPAA